MPLTCFYSESLTVSAAVIAGLSATLAGLVDDDFQRAKKRLYREIRGQSADAVHRDEIPQLLSKFNNITLSSEAWTSICSKVIARTSTRQSVKKRRVVASGAGSSADVLPIADLPVAGATVPVLAVNPIDVTAQRANVEPGELQMVLLRTEARSRDLEAMLKKARKALTETRATVRTLRERLQQEQHACSILVAERAFRPGIRNLSLKAGYTLALRRNLAHAAAGVAAKMVMGDKESGGEVAATQNTVIMYEHKAAAAKRLRSKLTLSKDRIASDLVPLDNDMILGVICYKGDATQQEAIDKEKVHVSLITTVVACLQRSVSNELGFDFDTAAKKALYVCEAGDIQPVKSGTGAETYGIITKELTSVGVPTWFEKMVEADPKCISMYWFGLDNGPDNVGHISRVRGLLELSPPTVMFGVVWCMQHQAHLIVKSVLEVADNFQFTDKAVGCSYWSALSAIAYVWRSPGMGRKIIAAARRLKLKFAFNKVPGRPLKNRWGTIGSIEQIVIDSQDELRAVWDDVVVCGAPEARRRKGPGGDEDAEFKEKQRAHKGNSSTAVRSPAFFVLVRLVNTARKPITIFQLWMQKRTKRYNSDVAAASAREEVHLGPVPLSDVVAHKADEVRNQLENLLTDDSQWGDLFDYMQRNGLDLQEGHCLIVHIVLMELASWDFRMMRRVKSHTLQILIFVEKMAHEACPERRRIARSLINTSDCCLRSNESDVPVKIKLIFPDELAVVADTGRVPLNLYHFVLMLRSQAPMDTQDVEGMNSTLQTMSKAAPRLQLPLASDRMQLKKGQKISATACQDLHQGVMEEATKDNYLNRFAIVACDASPPEAGFKLCNHRFPEILEYGTRFAVGACRHKMIGAKYVFSFSSREGVGFVMAWSYFYTVFVAVGDIKAAFGDDFTFDLKLPIEVVSLADFIPRLPRFNYETKVMRLFRRSLGWTSRTSAVASSAATRFDVKPSKLKKAAGAAVPAAGAAGPDVEEEENEIDLEQALGLILEEEGLEGEDVLEPSGGAEEEAVVVAEIVEPSEFDVEADEEPSAPRVVAGLPIDDPQCCALLAAVRKVVRHSASNVREVLSHVLLHSTAPTLSGKISLVQDKASLGVFFVFWLNASDRIGRRICTDAHNRIVSLCPVTMPARSWREVHVLIPDIGHTMTKVPKHERPAMPEWCLTARSFFEASKFAGPIDEGTCVVCAAAGNCLLSSYKEPRADQCSLYKCSVCLQGWHDMCMMNPMQGFEEWDLHHGSTEVGVDCVCFRCPVCLSDGRRPAM